MKFVRLKSRCCWAIKERETKKSFYALPLLPLQETQIFVSSDFTLQPYLRHYVYKKQLMQTFPVKTENKYRCLNWTPPEQKIFMFMFMHLTDAFIQNDLQMR